MVESTANFTLKRAARTLGVHEQTLRNWEARGLIRMVRLPGSHYRRVPAAEVERLQAAMQETAPVLPAISQPVALPAVRLAPPNRTLAAQQQALSQANDVCAELAAWEAESTFDAVMATRRGRTWLP